MRLEDSRDMLVLIQLTDTPGTLVDLFRVVGIIAEENDTVGLDLKVETTVNTAIGS